jgi:hypothetical protein
MANNCVCLWQECGHCIPGAWSHCIFCSALLIISTEVQIVDDILDYESASTILGKPGGADLQLGLATGPALYAWEEHPEMGELIRIQTLSL